MKGEILDRAMNTVRNHVSAALHHYGVSNQAQLIAKLMRDRKPVRNGRYAELTPAQKRVVDLLAKGQSQAQIARRLQRSPLHRPQPHQGRPGNLRGENAGPIAFESVWKLPAIEVRVGASTYPLPIGYD